MSSLGTHLAKSLLQIVRCRHSSLAKSSTPPANLGRRWLSDSTSSVSAESPTEPPSDEVPTSVKNKTGQPPKPKPPVDEKAATFEDGTPVPPKTKAKAREAATEEAGESFVRPKSGRPRKDTEKLVGVVRPQRPLKAIVDPALISPMELPPPGTWSQYFPSNRDWAHRTTLSNAESARQLAELFVPEGSKDKIIIEANAGAGQLSRALLALPKERIKKLILIEDASAFVSSLKVLEADPRVVFLAKQGKQWSTYTDMEADGLLDDAKIFPWEEVNDQLQFIMTISTDVHGEQLVSQLMRAVPDRQWLFKYGRMPMNLLMTTRMWERVSAPVHSGTRFLPLVTFAPHWEYFYPTRFAQSLSFQIAATSIVPKAHQIITSGDLDLWDYCLRKLFVLRATRLSGALFTLGAGAVNILPKLTDPNLPVEQRVDCNKTIRDLNVRDWSLIVEAFRAWPFRPTDLTIESHAGRHSQP